MAIGDIYLLRDRYHALYGTEAENVYFYIGTGDGLAPALAQAFSDELLAEIAAMQPLDWTHYQFVVQSLFDPTDYVVFTVDADGTWPTETTAPFTAVNYSLQIPTRAIRAGSKRIGPVPEDAAENGLLTDVDYLVAANIVRVKMADSIAPSGEPSMTFAPVVVKRIKFVEDGVTKYRLPTSFGEAVYAPVTGVTLNPLVSHQTSRRRGA